MPEYIEIPLHLCQVCEEEFEDLHESLTDGPFTLMREGDAAGVAVVARKDWLFHAGHVHAGRLAAMLKSARDDWRREQGGAPDSVPDGPALQGVRDLATYLVFAYPKLLKELEAEAQRLTDWHRPVAAEPEQAPGPKGPEVPPPDENAAYLKTLNAVLEDASKRVFVRERFEGLSSLRDETRELMEFGWGETEMQFDGSRPTHGASDLTRFKRLLLEDALPEAFRRVYDVRLSRVFARVHARKTGRAAICLSGGGIRSGTFSLGVLQGLARQGFLDKFDYLSTVSGGGYIGGWLTAWIHRHPKSLDGVIAELNTGTPGSRLEPEPAPLRYLRDYSSFITPRTGVLSADTWTFVAIYVRNLLLNWVVLVPLLASVLLIPRVADAVVVAPPGWGVLTGLLVLASAGVLLLKPSRALAAGLAVLDALLVALIFLTRKPADAPVAGVSSWDAPTALLVAGTVLGGYALAYMRLNRPSNSSALGPGSFWDKHRDQNSFLWFCLLPLSLSATTLTTFWAWFRTTIHNAESPPVYFLGWQMSELVGFLLYGLMLGVTGWLLYIVLAGYTWLGGAGGREYVRRVYKDRRRQMAAAILKNAGVELVVTLAASLVGALLLYAFAVNIETFYRPVTDPFTQATYADGVKNQIVASSLTWSAEAYTCLAFPTYLLIFFLGMTIFVGLTSRRSERMPGRRPPQGFFESVKEWLRPYNWVFVEDEDREWLARAAGWLFILSAGWALLSALVIFGPLAFIEAQLAVGGISGLVSVLGARSARTPGGVKKEGQQQSIWATLGVNLLVVAAFLFFACLVVAVSLLTATVVAWLAKYLPNFALGYWTGGQAWGFYPTPPKYLAEFRAHYPFGSPENVFRGLRFPTWFYLLAFALALQVFGRIAARLINLNKFSLHAGYRDRIVRAFLGASRLKGERRENPFTGFDPRDNLNMEELRPGLLRESDFKKPEDLDTFVSEINRPGVGDAGRRSEPRRAAAQYLREQIVKLGGESARYFKDPPESVRVDPSLRSALFADLGHILQDCDFGEAPGLAEAREAAEHEYAHMKRPRGDRRVMLNRLMLTNVFPYIRFPPEAARLMHVVNMTLNLVGGDRLAWQQRRAESFTSTPLHSGSLFVGYRRTREYGGRNGIKLGTAVAISGAAASSNMGYFSPSPFVTLVLTFFNARLGWWLGNPGVYGADTFYLSHPRKALSPIIDEAFGLTDDEHPYVLLSDGGHFENLGLYEMVLRRCRHIFVVDGSADPEGTYSDLGGAVRKIRIDLGVRIEFERPFPIFPRPASEEDKEGQKGGYVAVGRIYYGDADGDIYVPKAGGGREPLVGTLVYIKPAFYGTEPRDIYNYAKGNVTFPHESTADQFFDEPQFESHRALGSHVMECLVRKNAARPDMFKDETAAERLQDNLGEFVRHLREQARKRNEGTAAAHAGAGRHANDRQAP
ncbi:MAG TPA: patatin-like phospholipase family protein [Pyrinomonadaceae bacterium]|nr:patatin-like phospholipase family protein [Pyrinomonadaceae bacterium]